MGSIMAFKIYQIGLILLLLPSIAVAYQQAYLVFDAPGWQVYEQVSDSQTFTKGELKLDIRATQSSFMNSVDFARDIKGKIESATNYSNFQEVVIANNVTFYVFVKVPYKDHFYFATITGPKAQMANGKIAMQSILKTFSFASAPQVIQAPWEKEPVPPKRLSFLTTHPIPWDWIILFVTIGGIVLLFVRKVMKRKQHKHGIKHDEHKN